MFKQRRNTQLGHKRKDKSKYLDKHRWRNVIAWTLPFLIVAVTFTVTANVTGVWLSIFIWCAFFVYTVAMLERYIWHDSNRLVRISGAGLCVALIIAGVVWKSRIPAPIAAFSSRIRASPFGSYERTRGGVFFIIYNRGEGEIVTPAQLGLYIEIINQQDHEALIDSYTVEAQNRSGEWFKLIRLDAGDGPVFLCIEDFHKAKPLDLSNGLDRQLRDRPITAHGTVRGWAFFELPQTIRDNSLFRITAEDNNGASGQTANNENLSPTKDYVQDAELRFAVGLRDLSASRFMMYSELFKERIQN